ncbi:hypothetical protein PTSG_07871 [Salpingoeca rosetta]|uniref:Uncharacterized protein n=1 Tax=Salpingoeca rosetta (strain ATCC 50818 / BSB-021) TaxID=946362 RepID=F2UGK4_SALR5|nr:uncharacterized protein PTSG_07871 [Salpingoeca rosetta]EGD75754.1 hypothetical protein PTSG_07871 [Salpingoeca rosetta]|eukprot:XP_004991675.1 hypothetical protein PTSG_07871 [Salpingoeca rosetta]
MMARRGAAVSAAVLLIGMLMCVNVHGAVFTWKEDGCNTNFNNDANWDGGAPVVVGHNQDDAVTTTVYFGPKHQTDGWKPVTSLVHAGKYATKQAIVFADNGVLEFAPHGAQMVFHKTHPSDVDANTDDADVTVFTGGQTYRPECDFNCHKNWETSFNTTRPPCMEDDAFFPMTSSYHIFTGSFAPITSLTLDSVRVALANDEHLPPSFSSPAYGSGSGIHFSRGNSSMDRLTCELEAQFDVQQRACVCFSTCPSLEQQLADEALANELAIMAVNSTLNDARRPKEKLVAYTFKPLAILSLSPELQAAVEPQLNALGSADNEAVKHHMTRLAAEVLPDLRFAPGASCNLTYAPSSDTLAFAARVTGPAIAVDAIASVASFDTLAPGPREVLELLAWRASTSHIRNRTVEACLQVNTTSACAYLSGLDSAMDAADRVETATVTVEFSVGDLLPPTMLTRLFQSYNDDTLRNLIADTLSGTPPITKISGDQVRIRPAVVERREVASTASGMIVSIIFPMLRDKACTASDTSPECTLPSSSERFSELATFLNAAVTVFKPEEPTCLSFTSGIDTNCTRAVTLADLTSAALASPPLPLSDWKARVETTFYASIGGCGLRCNVDGSFSDAQYEADVAAMFDSVYNQVRTLVLAVLSSADDDDADDDHDDDDDDGDDDDDDDDDNDGPGSRSGSVLNDSEKVGVGVGSAVGVLLVAGLVLIVMRNRRRNPRVADALRDADSKKSADDSKTGARPVVSFSNPMYNENGDVEELNTLYNAAEDTGLYDAPAFNDSSTKQNPMYRSSEALQAKANDADGGDGGDGEGDGDGEKDGAVENVAENEADEGSYIDVAPTNVETLAVPTSVQQDDE